VRCLGESFLPVRLAGQRSVHRPHSVQEYMSRIAFQLKSVIFEAPKASWFSMSAIGTSRPWGRRSRKKTLGIDVTTWKCLP
jgi:hypothetical protein